MNSISNDHPSAYYRCDYEPFVCFIMALNRRGFNECWDVKPSPPRLGRSQGLFNVAQRVLGFFTHSALLFVSFYSSQPRLLTELFMASTGMAMHLGFCKTSREENMGEYSL